MKNFKSHFKFNKQERSGIFFLLFLIVVLQIGYFVYVSYPVGERGSGIVDTETQARIDDLKTSSTQKDSIKIYPFNPNFITDYKGYTLGMSVTEIDKLHAYRALDRYVNTVEDFQSVTNISDSLLAAISPYFKFPEWTKKSKQYAVKSNQNKSKQNGFPSSNDGSGTRSDEIKDLNSASIDDLRAINGIGEKLSARIIKFRDRLGGFLINDQLYDVYGLDPEVAKRALAKFKVIDPPEVKKINVTWASYNELRKVLYINDKFANSIIEYRKNYTIMSLSDLKELEGFPEGKFERIELYLSL